MVINVNSDYADFINASKITRMFEVKLLQWDDNQTTLTATELLVPTLQSKGYWVKVGLRLLPRESIGNIEQIKLEVTKTYSQKLK